MSIPTKHLFTLFRRSFATKVSAPKLRFINPIRKEYKPIVVRESQKALTAHLHETQGLPFFFADQIANNSLFSLSKLFPNLRFSLKTFPSTIRKLLRYQSINEFEFFFESIGIDHSDIARYLPRDMFSMSDGNGVILGASAALFQFGFPWNTLGKLYTNKVSIFSRHAGELATRLGAIREYCGFDNLQLVGVCLAFPELLIGEGDLGGDFESLFEDLKRVFEEFRRGGCAEGNLDGWYEVCCKIRFLYEFGCEKGTVWEYVCSEKRFLLECPEHVLEDKANYFCKFGVGKDKVGVLLLKNQELLVLDLQTPVIMVSELLQHFGLDDKELELLSKKYPHVFGRNKMDNIPGIARALDLHEWFFDNILSLVTYAIDHSDEVDNKFQDDLKEIESTRYHSYTTTQLDFLMGLGFGENASTLNVLRGLQAANSGLQKRFDHLLSLGIKYSDLCLTIKMAPRIVCLDSELAENKINYLCNEMGSSINYLGCFPGFLLYDLENRIKPRHRFWVWLKQIGLSTKNYSIQGLIDISEKRFIARVLNIHQAAPKLYLEFYLRKS